MTFYISNAVATERIIFISLAILAFGLVAIGSLWLLQWRLSAQSAGETAEVVESDFAVIAKELQPALKKAVRPLAPSLYEKLTPEEKLLRAIFRRLEKGEREQASKPEAESASPLSR